VPRLPFRFTPRSAAELAAAVLLALVGLIFILGTTDEYKARKAFNFAMDSYAAGIWEDVYDGLEDAWHAKPDYAPPREVYGKLLVDEGYKQPKKFTEAKAVFKQLESTQRDRYGKPSLPVMVGLAVTDIETVRAGNPTPQALAAALRQARDRLEEALIAYPDSGDAHVNLATIALLQGDSLRCKAELRKVVEVGNIGVDALPVMHNLRGLLAMREGDLGGALAGFQQVREFRPDWDVPQLNLAAAHANALAAPNADPQAAQASAFALRRLLPRVQNADPQLYGHICQILGAYHTRTNNPTEAERRFAQAERVGKLSWQSRFNQAVARYLNVAAARGHKPSDFDAPAAELARTLANPQASVRDKYLASCLLGTIEGDRGNTSKAIEHFLRAAATPAAADPFVRATLPLVHTSLAGLYYESGQLAKVAEHLELAKDTTNVNDRRRIAAFAKLLQNAPRISDFAARLEKIYTPYDLVVSANLATPASPKPLGRDNVALALIETRSNTKRPLPFHLNGPFLYAVALNMPEGKYRVELTLTDPFGASDKATSETIEVDRDPPRAVQRKPAPGASVASLPFIEFTLEDQLSSVDLETVRVMLRYPLGSPLAARLLVTGGKYQYASADGSVRRFAPIANKVRAPLPKEKPLKGQYHVIVHAQDTSGNARDIEWSFVLNPGQ